MDRPVSARKRQRGIAIVEFTLALPLLLLLMLASVEIGRLLFQYNALTKAVRDGARYVASEALLGSTGTVFISDQLRDETRNLVVHGNTVGNGDALVPGLDTDDVEVENDPPGSLLVSVSAEWNYIPILGNELPTFGLGDPIPLTFLLSSTVIMQAL